MPQVTPFRSSSSVPRVPPQGAIATADPYRKVPVLMEGVLERIAVARGKMERRELGQASRLLSSAISLVHELRRGLDPQTPQDTNQNELYGYVIRQLTNANLNARLEILDEVSHLVREMHVAWFLLPPPPSAPCAPGAALE